VLGIRPCEKNFCKVTLRQAQVPEIGVWVLEKVLDKLAAIILDNGSNSSISNPKYDDLTILTSGNNLKPINSFIKAFKSVMIKVNKNFFRTCSLDFGNICTNAGGTSQKLITNAPIKPFSR